MLACDYVSGDHYVLWTGHWHGVGWSNNTSLSNHVNLGKFLWLVKLKSRTVDPCIAHAGVWRGHGAESLKLHWQQLLIKLQQLSIAELLRTAQTCDPVVHRRVRSWSQESGWTVCLLGEEQVWRSSILHIPTKLPPGHPLLPVDFGPS
jgi:hypothetical protein